MHTETREFQVSATLPYSLTAGSLGDPGAGPAVCKPHDPISPQNDAEITDAPSCSLLFYMSVVDLNSGPPIYIVSVLSPLLSLSPTPEHFKLFIYRYICVPV